MSQRILATLAYMLPTFPLAYFWHLTVFAKYYEGLNVYREQITVPLGIASMLTQGVVWSIVYEKMFAGKPFVQGALQFASLAFPLAWSFSVAAVAAKHHMSSVVGYMTIETIFVFLQYMLVSPLIAYVYQAPRRHLN